MLKKELHENCLMGSNVNNTFDYYIPVFGSDGYLYRNKFCAKCNSVPEFEMVKLKKDFTDGGKISFEMKKHEYTTLLSCSKDDPSTRKFCSKKERIFLLMSCICRPNELLC